MTKPQIPANPLKDPDLPFRFARLIVRYQTRRAFSDKAVVIAIKAVPGMSAKGSTATHERYRDAMGGQPSAQMIGLYAKALDIPENEIDLLLDPTATAQPGTALLAGFSDLIESMARQSQLPARIEQERLAARVAFAENDLAKARKHLDLQQSLLGRLYDDSLDAARHHADEYARALASLGSLAFMELDYATARQNYGKAATVTLLDQVLKDRYARSYLIGSNAVMRSCANETAARAILAEMQAAGVTPDVVSYSTLLTFAKGEDAARAILAEMQAAGVTPDEITIITALRACSDFASALRLIDECIANGNFVGRGAFEAAYSFPIAHMPAEDLLAAFHARPFKFDTALQSPINQYLKTRKPEEVLKLILTAPHVGAMQKFYRNHYPLVKSYLEAEIAAGTDDDNLHYAYGIAAALNKDWDAARRHLQVARERAYAEKRIAHIDALLRLIP